MGRDFRCLANECEVHMAQPPTCLRQTRQSLGHENFRRHPPPARIAGGKKLADIPCPYGPQNGIHQGMKRHIRIGMAHKGCFMGNGDSTQHHLVSRPKNMDIETLPATHLGLTSQLPFRHGQILCGGQFAIAGTPPHDGHRQAGPFRNGGVIGKVLGLCLGRCLVCRQDIRKMKALGGLGGPEIFPIHRVHHPCAIGAFQGVRHRECRQNRRRLRQGRHDPIDHGSRQKRPRPIMDEHPLWCHLFQGPKPAPNRFLPGFPPRHRWAHLGQGRGKSRREQLCIVGPDYRLNHMDGRMVRKNGKTAGDHGLPAKFPILFGQIVPSPGGTTPFSRCDNDDSRFLCLRLGHESVRIRCVIWS